MKNNKKGFTLAELLIVVAIIGVLVAISIPVFTTQLEKSREAVDLANIRAAYAEAASEAITNQAASTKDATLTQKTAGWATANPSCAGQTLTDSVAVVGGKVYVTVAADGTVTIGNSAPTGGSN